jgi:hypothetical protein
MNDVLTINHNNSIDDIIKLCDNKISIYENTIDNDKIRSTIFNYCKEKKLVLDKTFNFNSYIIYSINPFIDANNLCNLLYKIKKYVKLATFLYRQEFCIFDIYNQLVVIKPLIIKSNMLFDRILFDKTCLYKNIFIKTYPDIIYAIYYFSSLYKPKNYKLEKLNNYDINYNALLNYPLEKQLIKINKYEMVIRRNVFYKLKSINKSLGSQNIQNIIYLDYYGLKLRHKKNFKYIINIIYHNPFDIFYYIKKKCSTKKINFHYKIFDNLYIDDFRFNKIAIYATYNNYDYLIMNIYNNTSFEVIPCYVYKNNVKPHKFVFNKFLLLSILNLLVYNKDSNGMVKKLIKYYKKYNNRTFNKYEIKYCGIYKDLNFAKKNYNNSKDINNYIPLNYELINKKLRTFN